MVFTFWDFVGITIVGGLMIEEYLLYKDHLKRKRLRDMKSGKLYEKPKSWLRFFRRN